MEFFLKFYNIDFVGFSLRCFNPIALMRTAKTLWSFGRSECSRVKAYCNNWPGYHIYLAIRFSLTRMTTNN